LPARVIEAGEGGKEGHICPHLYKIAVYLPAGVVEPGQGGEEGGSALSQLEGVGAEYPHPA
jgi:hypothetical protein